MSACPCLNCGSDDARFSCSICRTAKYCSQECQKAHWKRHKSEGCQSPAQTECTKWLNANSSSSSSKRSSQSIDAPRRTSSLLNPDNSFAAEAYRKLRLSEKVESDYYFNVHKNYLRDKLTIMQREAHQFIQNQDFANVSAMEIKMRDELKKQYFDNSNVATNDTCSSLQLKIVLGDVLYGLCHDIPNFTAENTKTAHKKKMEVIINAMIEKFKVKAMCCCCFLCIILHERLTLVNGLQ